MPWVESAICLLLTLNLTELSLSLYHPAGSQHTGRGAREQMSVAEQLTDSFSHGSMSAAAASRSHSAHLANRIPLDAPSSLLSRPQKVVRVPRVPQSREDGATCSWLCHPPALGEACGRRSPAPEEMVSRCSTSFAQILTAFPC